MSYLNKLICFEDERIIKMAFTMDYEGVVIAGLVEYYDTKCVVDLGMVESHLLGNMERLLGKCT